MKSSKQIVFLKNSKSNDFVYTANIKSIRLDGNSYIVIFDNGNDYRYGRDKVLIYEFSSYRNEVNIYVDGQLQNQYSAAYDYHKYYLFAGQSIISEAIEKGKNIEIYDIKTNLDRVRATFEYFKEISAFPNLFNQEEDLEDNRSVNQTSSDIIVKALARIKIRDNVSVLANYLEGVTPITYDYNKAIIYPFGCNESQKCAVERALKNSVSIVEGPPGTGKTQTILNIIANVVSDNQSVAVVSNNNSAVYNIQEKLNKYGYGSLVATLGSNENKAAFFEHQSTIERFEEAELSKQQIYDVDKQISTISARITESLQKRNEVAKLKSMLKEVECQAQHFIAAHNSESHKQIEKKFHRCNSLQKSFKLRKLLLNGNLSLSTKLILFFQYGFYDIFRVEDYSAEFITFANYKFYEQYIASIRSEIIELERWLEEQNEQLQLKELIELSKQLFTAKLFDKYSTLDDIALTKDN